MKKLIDKKLYDTEKADFVHSYIHHDEQFSNMECEDRLYITKKGNWFLVVEDIALDEWDQPGAGEPSNVEDLRALTATEAFAWLVEHEAFDTVKQYFPDEIEEA